MQALLRRRQWAFLRGHRARGRLLLLRRVVGTGVLARIIKIAPVRESGARSQAEREHAEQEKKFHAASNQIGPGAVNGSEKAIARTPASREVSLPSGAMD